MTPLVVLKLGGELLLDPSALDTVARVVADSSRVTRLVVVHGGGRDIDAALARAAIPVCQVEGVRVTDAATLDVVISVLAGLVNTRLVARVVQHGGLGVGLTGADAGTLPATRCRALQRGDGPVVDLGLVGEPRLEGAPPLLMNLLDGGFVPILASIGLADDGQLLNVNADAFAASLAVGIAAERLIVAGGTDGVLDRRGETHAALTASDIDALIANGSAHRGMVVKLRSALVAANAGVQDVVISNGTDTETLRTLVVEGRADRAGWTRIVASEAVDGRQIHRSTDLVGSAAGVLA